MKKYRAEFRRRNETGRECCAADTIADLLVALTLRGYSSLPHALPLENTYPPGYDGV